MSDELSKLQVGDKLVLKNKKKVPSPLLGSAKDVTEEFEIKEIQATYATIGYSVTKEFALENNEGKKKREVSFHEAHIWNWFKKKK